MRQADVRIGDRVEGRPGDGAARFGTVLAVEDGGDYGQPGKVARVSWDKYGASYMNAAHLKLLTPAARKRAEAAEAVETAEAMTRGTRWEETPAGFRGESEDVYSAAVAAIAAVLAGQDKVQTVAPGWTVRGELRGILLLNDDMALTGQLSGPEIRVVAIPADDAAGRAAVQGMKRMRGG